MRNKPTITILVLLAVLLFSVAVFAADNETVDNWKTVPVNAGDGLYLPCASGIVTAFVTDGMAVVECHALPTKK